MKSWVKLWTERVLSLEFNMLSLEAQNVWFKCYVLAGRCDAGGLLIANGRPLGLEDLYSPKITSRKRSLAVEELVFHGFLVRRGNGTLEIPNWERDQRTKDAVRKQQKFHGNSAEIPQETLPEIPPEIPRTEDIEPPTLVDKSTRSGGDAAVAAPWVLTLKDQVRPLLDGPLPGLMLEQRLVLGRYVAYRFANCTKNEPANRKNGLKFAGQIAEISSKKRFSAVSVREFLGAANRVWEASEKYPLYSLWTVSAAFEDEKR